MDAKKKVVKPKAKKPLKKGKKPKPKTKLKQKQIQSQTQKVIVNLGEVKKRTRRVATSKKKPPLTAFSGSAQAPILVNPFDNVYRDLIQPVKEQQRQFQSQQQQTMQRRQNELDALRNDFRRGFVGINERLSQLQSTGDVTQQVPPPQVKLEDAFEESRRMDAEQPEGTAVARRGAFESSSEPPFTEAVVVSNTTPNFKTRTINKKIKEFLEKNERLPSLRQAKAFSKNKDFQALRISKGEIEVALKNYKMSVKTRSMTEGDTPPSDNTRNKNKKKKG